MITRIHRFGKWIGRLWLALMLLSIGLVALHRHDVKIDANHCHEQHDQDHQHPEDCAYCFLYFQQGIDCTTGYHWTLAPMEIFLAPVIIGEPLSPYFVRQFHVMGLRGPPAV